MAEYIKKEKLFDCLDIKNALGGHYGISLTAINAIPAADVVEVVRCKDCRYRDPEDHKCDCGHDILWQLPRDDDWFCADGERKGGDE